MDVGIAFGLQHIVEHGVLRCHGIRRAVANQYGRTALQRFGLNRLDHGGIVGGRVKKRAAHSDFFKLRLHGSGLVSQVVHLGALDDVRRLDQHMRVAFLFELLQHLDWIVLLDAFGLQASDDDA